MRAALRLSLVLAVAACGGSDTTGPGGGGPQPGAPVPGVVAIGIVSPNPDDGAILFNVSGAIQSVAAASGYQVLSYSPVPSQTKVLVTGSIVNGPVLSLNVADKSKPVIVSVEQAAARGTYTQRTATDYQITYSR